MNEGVTIDSNCPVCGKGTRVEMTRSQLLAWRNGAKVQELFPEWSTIERETLMTGICSDDCWEKYVG